jgi:hypothetical protein
MKGRAAVTLSNENGLSHSRPDPEPHPAISGRQRPPCTPQRARSPKAARHFRAGMP